PHVTIFVFLRAVTGEVFAGILRPVGVAVTLIIAPQAAQHGWPRFGDHEVTGTAVGNGFAGVINNIHFDTGKGDLRGTRLGVRDAGQRRNHDCAGLGLPPGVHDRGLIATDDAAVPDPGFRVDGFTDGSK